MKSTLVQLGLLLVLIGLIAGSMVVDRAHGPAAQVPDDGVVLPLSGQPQIAATERDSRQGDCGKDCSHHCLQSTGLGCCSASVPFADESGIFDRALIAVAEALATAIDATGIDSVALLHPPQNVG